MNPAPFELVDPSLGELVKWFVYQPPSVRRKIDTVISEPTPGRNDPCPCGSGQKYKKCCLNNKE